MTGSSSDSVTSPYLRARTRENRDAKRAIAVKIAETFVRDNDSVILDAGSTAEMIADELFCRRSHLSVLTHNMRVYVSHIRALSASSDPAESGENQLLITGGRYDHTYEALLGPYADASIESHGTRVIIIGVSGLRSEDGAYCRGAYELSMKRLFWGKPTDRRIIATDWSKLGSRDVLAFGKLEQMHFAADEAILVTNEPPASASPDARKVFEREVAAIESQNVQVVRVDVPAHSEEK